MAFTPARLRRPALLALATLLGGGCYDFHLDGPEDAPPVSTPRTVSVVVQYGQQSQCRNAPERCGDPVIFFGSWMRPGQEFALVPAPGRFVWTGMARDVPVNFPPRGRPYLVRLYDPYLQRTSSEGFTARRLEVGGQVLTRIESFGTQGETGLVYIDDNGLGHNPY